MSILDYIFVVQILKYKESVFFVSGVINNVSLTLTLVFLLDSGYLALEVFRGSDNKRRGTAVIYLNANGPLSAQKTFLADIILLSKCCLLRVQNDSHKSDIG